MNHGGIVEVPTRDDDEPAFPRSDGGYSKTHDGMSLRDWFAGQALAGIMANSEMASDSAPNMRYGLQTRC